MEAFQAVLRTLGFDQTKPMMRFITKLSSNQVSLGLFGLTFLWVLFPESLKGPSSLWPSLLALLLAYLTRDIYVALFAGAFSGCLLLAGGNPIRAFIGFFDDHLVAVLADPWNVSVILFSFMMGGLVEVLNRNGSMLALSQYFLGQSMDRRRAGLGTFAMGWVVFFDGLANCMLVGKTMRSVTDRAGISREKLAFIVDSTASPIASFALISTWIATEMGLILAGFQNAGVAQPTGDLAPYKLLIESLPFRFYNYFMLAIVFLTIWKGRELGPMWHYESKARSSGLNQRATLRKPKARSAWVGLSCLIVLVVGVFAGLWTDGGGGQSDSISIRSLIATFGRARADVVFLCVSGLVSVIAIWLTRLALPGVTKEPLIQVYLEGMRTMFMPMLILVLAFTLSHVVKDLETAQWLVALLGGWLPVFLLPVLVFLLSALMSFSTGTSWGTMGVVMPLAIPVALSLTQWSPGENLSTLVIATIGSVLAGSVFGDHCSPISDTTIVSSFASGCDPMDHVRSQLPYALIAGGIAALIGFLPSGLGVSVWLLLPLGFVGCWLCIQYKAKPVDGSPEASKDVGVKGPQGRP